MQLMYLQVRTGHVLLIEPISDLLLDFVTDVDIDDSVGVCKYIRAAEQL